MALWAIDKDGTKVKVSGMGVPGPAGKTAYQYAVDGGFSGTEQEFSAMLARHSNPDLLINSDFRNSVNQKRKQVYSGGFTIDRWRVVRGNVELEKNGILLTTVTMASGGDFGAYIDQMIEGNIDDQLVTASMLTDRGLFYVTGTVNPSNANLIYTSADQKVTVWMYRSTDSVFGLSLYNNDLENPLLFIRAKFELGPQQTLAHQDEDGNWVLNDPPPNKALERAKCQRYQFLGPFYAVHLTGAANVQYAVATLPVAMRTSPSIVGTPKISKVSTNEKIASVDVQVGNLIENQVLLTITGTNDPCYAFFGEGAGFDANL